ncbi:phosphatase PAP2 family protein [soil metagenome]
MNHHLSWTFWHLVTRLGEAGIILPSAIALAVWLTISSRQPRSAWLWLVPLGLAASLTTVTKLAFLGWGVGSATFNFTGISGHAMFATAIYPVMVRTLLGKLPPPWPIVGALVGFAIAALVAVSRVMIHAHSWSEVIAGFLVGGMASACALMLMASNPPRLSSKWLWAGLAGWLVVMPLRASPSVTHDIVTRVAITLADRDHPFSRADLFRTRVQ